MTCFKKTIGNNDQKQLWLKSLICYDLCPMESKETVLKLPEETSKEQVIRFLKNRGYSFETINKAMRKLS